MYKIRIQNQCKEKKSKPKTAKKKCKSVPKTVEKGAF